MAIYGAGSNWIDGEKKITFFENSCYSIGWAYDDAKDLYNVLSTFKVGDIIYLKSNPPGCKDIRIKGIGIVMGTFANELMNLVVGGNFVTQDKISIPVEWIIRDEFFIDAGEEGKLTNVRAATLYEESLLSVQKQIIEHLLSGIKSLKKQE